jgi:sulfite exporter TauE/SafE
LLTAFILGFGAGIAATPHCLGMCGGFPLHLAKSASKGSTALRQLLFVTGKCVTYVFLGAIAAAVGVVLLKDTALAGGAPLLRIVAGAITLAFGLAMLGAHIPFRRDRQREAPSVGLLTGALGGLFARPSPASALVLGLGVGFLPCPLPMGMLAAAAASHSVVHGMALMAGVGLGTAPGLLAVGLFGIGIDRRFKKLGMRAAGVIVVCIGLLTICRATGVMAGSHAVDSVVPPCCQEHSAK